MNPSQSKKHSVLEAASNVLVGFFIAVTTQVVVFPWFGIHIPLHDNFLIGALFTLVSLVRSYCLRRWWNWVHVNKQI